MSELIDVLEKCIKLVAEEEYPIDKVIMSEQRATAYITGLQDFLNVFLLGIKTEFPDIDKFKYRRLIFPSQTNPNEEGMIICNGEVWEVIKCSEYKQGEYEVFLKCER